MNNFNYYGQSPLRGMNPNFMSNRMNDLQQFNSFNRNTNQPEYNPSRNRYFNDDSFNKKSFRSNSPFLDAPHKSHYIQRPDYLNGGNMSNNFREEIPKFQNGIKNGNFQRNQNQSPNNSQRKTRDSFYDSLVIKQEAPKYDNLATFDIPDYQPPKKSTDKSGAIIGYAASTNRGIVRESNEDRVAIITNIEKINTPPSSFFGIYDGHGGAKCAEYLQENLHQYIIEDPLFPADPEKALRRGFERAEKEFTQIAIEDKGNIEPSGSCALVVMVVG